MRSLLVALFWAVNVSLCFAQDYNPFYQWANKIVTNAVFDEKESSVTILVTTEWEDDDISEQHRFALMNYIVCSRFAKEIEVHPTGDTLHMIIRLADSTRTQVIRVEGWIPRQEGICAYVLSMVQARIE